MRYKTLLSQRPIFGITSLFPYQLVAALPAAFSYRLHPLQGRPDRDRYGITRRPNAVPLRPHPGDNPLPYKQVQIGLHVAVALVQL